MATAINLIQAIHTVADANGELWNGFAVEEPEGVLFTDEFTDDMWNTHVTVPEGSKVTAAAVKAILPQHLKDLALRSVQLKRIKPLGFTAYSLFSIISTGLIMFQSIIISKLTTLPLTSKKNRILKSLKMLILST